MNTTTLAKKDIKPTPFMNKFECISILHALNTIDGKKTILEWGSGGSTLYFSSFLEKNSEWYSIEHDKEWFNKINKQIAINNCKISIILKSPSSEWTNGNDDGTFEQFRDYVLMPIKIQKMFDFIIVDGRARHACIHVGWEILNDEGIMILHDAQRKSYTQSLPKNSYTLKIVNTKIDIDGKISTLFLSKSSYKINKLSIILRNELPEHIQIIKNGTYIIENKLYAGDIPTHKNYSDWIGLSLNVNNENHIKHDITKRLPFENNSLDYYQAEDVFEHINLKKMAFIVDEIFRVLKVGGIFRLSVPDYGCDVLRQRSIIDERNNIVFDPEGGGTLEEPGHVWFPRIDTIKELLENSLFKTHGKIYYLHYFNMDGSFVVNKIDYTHSTVSRTPDYDQRVTNPYRPMSIVVDLKKTQNNP